MRALYSLITAAATGAALVAVPSLPAGAAEGSPAQDRARLLCSRVPNLQIRADKLVVRLQAGADTPGSVAWLKARADQARANGREELATVLDNRVVVRTNLLPVLKNQQQNLPKVAQWCAEHGFATGSGQ
ncbi:hypothetical protein [Micromonospora maritima]|uniref:hypothetical protein n=1 Tax=Micromonospora maritima TaxID=986711 RepID=UPI0037942B74